MMDAATVFARHFAAFPYESLPDTVIDAVKKQVLDYIGVPYAPLCG